MSVRKLKAKTTRMVLVLSFFFITVAFCGCLSTNSDRASKQISNWVPVGTSESDAIKIMSQHGFGVEHVNADDHGRDYFFARGGNIHDWNVTIHEQNGKVATTNFPVRVWFRLGSYNLGG